MPKFTFQWKDPDYSDPDLALSEKEHAKLRKLGAGEYLVVEFDTDNMTAKVKGRNRS